MAPRCLVEVKLEKFASEVQWGIFDFVRKTDLDYLENKSAFVFYINTTYRLRNICTEFIRIRKLISPKQFRLLVFILECQVHRYRNYLFFCSV